MILNRESFCSIADHSDLIKNYLLVSKVMSTYNKNLLLGNWCKEIRCFLLRVNYSVLELFLDCASLIFFRIIQNYCFCEYFLHEKTSSKQQPPFVGQLSSWKDTKLDCRHTFKTKMTST